MAILIDTNVVSELRKKSRCDPAVKTWQKSIRKESIYISTISMMEIKNGIITAQAKHPDLAEKLHLWYETQVKPTFKNHILPIDLTIAEQSAILLNQRTRPLADALIAATAHIHNLTLATRNTADFIDTGIKTVNPWNHPSN